MRQRRFFGGVQECLDSGCSGPQMVAVGADRGRLDRDPCRKKNFVQAKGHA